jgi:hypothetical protein
MIRGRFQPRARLRWKARRLQAGLRHGAALARMPVVFGNAIPKSGSKLLFNILRGLQALGPFIDSGLNSIKPFLPDGQPMPEAWIERWLAELRPGDLRFGYLYASAQHRDWLRGLNAVHFLILRDPRDLIVSEVFYALDLHPGHALHDHFHALPGMEERIATLIEGIPSGPLQRVGVRGHYERFLPWLDEPNLCLLRFEDLIARRDGQLGRILDVLEARGFKLQIDREAAIGHLAAQMAPEKSETFRKGKSGGWRQHFTEANIQQFKALGGDLLIRLGYEHAETWAHE